MNKVIEYILYTIATDIDTKWVCKLSFVEFAISSSVNALIGKTPFGLVYGQLVRNVINLLDGLHHIKGSLLMVDNILKLVKEAKTKLM